MTKSRKRSNSKTTKEVNVDGLDLHDLKALSYQWHEDQEFSALLVQRIYELYFINSKEKLPDLAKIGYFEDYLWKHLSADSILEHYLSIISLLNEKFSENAQPLQSFYSDDDNDKLQIIFNFVLFKFPSTDLSLSQKTLITTFLVYALLCFDIIPVRQYWLKYFSLSIWKSLSPERLNKELQATPQLENHWNHLNERLNEDATEATEATSTSPAKRKVKSSKGSSSKKQKVDPQVEMEFQWFPSLVEDFLAELDCPADDNSNLRAQYLEKLCELFIDLLSQLPTRRFVHSLLDDYHLIVRCQRSALGQSGNLHELIFQLNSVFTFGVENQTGKCYSSHEIIGLKNQELQRLQQIAYSNFRETLSDLIFSSSGELGKEVNLRKILSLISTESLVDLARKLGYVSSTPRSSDCALTSEFLLDIFVEKLCFRPSEITSTLYPTEKDLWDDHLLPLNRKYSGQEALPLPKMNLQFLSMNDYLSRIFTVFQLESTYTIRQNLQDALRQMAPRQTLSGAISFGGKSRMATPILSLRMERVVKPDIGESIPASVTCSFRIDLAQFQGSIRDEWENLRPNEVLFLIGIQNPQMEVGNVSAEREDVENGGGEEDLEFRKKYGIKYVRVGEILEIRDEDDVILNDLSRPDERATGRIGTKRKFTLNLDPAQYYEDMKGGVECYEGLNLLVRRHSKENNFKSVLKTIADLKRSPNLEHAIPEWLSDIMVGYGNPAATHYRNLPIPSEMRDEGCADREVCDYRNTFLNLDHVRQSFPTSEVEVSDSCQDSPPPYRLSIRRSDENSDVIQVLPSRVNPFLSKDLSSNSIKFTPRQIEAIRSGMNHGLSIVVGPPGTGKTEVALQLICNLYHNFPTQRILVVTHSNRALNELFEKILKSDVHPRHLVRLGHGEKDVLQSEDHATEFQYSKVGRVSWSLSRRQELLSQVQNLSSSLSIAGDVGYSCETANYFHMEHIQPRLRKYQLDLAASKAGQHGDMELVGIIENLFPFRQYFSSVEFTGDLQQDEMIASNLIECIQNIFQELVDYRPYELLRTQHLRTEYLLSKQARIVAMTSTHAAIAREKMIDLGFKYDSLVIEEASQMPEADTLIPMFLQNSESSLDGSRLKRVVLIGDSYQLPSMIHHPVLQNRSRFTQSMFSRFLRLGTPVVRLDQQGQTRPEIAKLYSWRYATSDGFALGNLPHVDLKSDVCKEQFTLRNPGFLYPFQFINVPDFQGSGESSPTPNSYQNVGEAEYIVALYQYMRLLGYPANKITILTTYSAQRQLISEIIAQRCKKAYFGPPNLVTTVDSYRGQQNDFVLLSLVRTSSIGYLRDVHRLIVALSRARLGLYVLCRKELFESTPDLLPIFQQVPSNSNSLQLVKNEIWPSQRRIDETIPTTDILEVADVTAMGLKVYEMTMEALKKPQIR